MKKDFFTTKEIAAKYGLKEGSIRSYIERGQLEATKVGTTYIITPEQLAAWESTRKPRKRAKE